MIFYLDKLYVARLFSTPIMDKIPEAEYKEFEEKVKRTICIDYVSPQASESVLKEAFNQFGTVRSICFIPNYLGPTNRGKSVLIEMDDVKQASDVISTLNKFPFMICGMPRPVQARAAEKEMFVDRPSRPGRKIKCGWLEPNDPDFKVAKKLKMLAKKQAEEAAHLLKVTQNPINTYIQTFSAAVTVHFEYGILFIFRNKSKTNIRLPHSKFAT